MVILVAGDNEKEKFITPPEDILEPVTTTPGYKEGMSNGLVLNTLRILETETGELYINPDAQHVGSFESSSDIIRIYSREIQALRQVVTLLMGISTNMAEIIKRRTGKAVCVEDYYKVIKYLENASWELALVNDPRLPGTHPE